MELDFDDLMNGHQQQPSISKSVATSQPPTSTPVGENPYLHQPESGLKLCAELIANSDKHSVIARKRVQINQIIEQQFLPHCKTAENMAAADTYAQLLKLERVIGEIASFPHLEKYHTVAVGGSFSAGKSRFLNAVLGCDSLLPTDTTPTTSIPTYITRGEQDAISALNFYQKKTAIDEDALKAICHAFNKRFGVTFSHLLQLISVERQNFKYPQLVFLDTPGYNKADDIVDSANNTDEHIAREHLSRADYLIWLVDQQNGTIPQPDIEFLQSLVLSQPVLIVISKTDKKPAAQIEKIITTARADLQRADIAFLDVIGYSAQTKQEQSPSQSVLANFLTQVSQVKNGSAVLWQLNQIFKNYINHFDSARQTLSLTSKTIKEIVFDEALGADKKAHLNDIRQKNKSQMDAVVKHKREAEEIQQQLAEHIAELCQYLQVKTTLQPSQVALKSYYQQETQQDTVSRTVSFDALLQGDVHQLANIADLTDINGKIARLSAVGVHVDIGMDFDIIITKQKIKELLGEVALTDHFTPEQALKVHIVNNKKASITIELADA